MAQATESTTKKSEAPPRSAAEWHRQGNALIDDGKLDRAISAFRRALRMDDSLAEVHNDLGAAYFQKQWYAEAEECFRKAIERDPRHAVAHANRGAALRSLGRLNDSRRAYQRALWLRLLGALPRFLRRPASAAQEALARHPEDPDVLYADAIAREANKQYADALPLVRKAVARRADRSDYHILLARLLLRAGDLNGALEAASTALRLEPGSAVVHAVISGIFHPWRNDLAEQAARHALELDAGLAQAHASLGAALWGQSRLEEAERAMREAARLEPKAIAHRAGLALILKDMDRPQEARALYRELIAEAPEHGKVCLDVGTLALESEGDLQTARAMYRKAQASADDPRAYLAEALVDFMEGRFEAGWPKYEMRKKMSDTRILHDPFAFVPDWDGAPLREGKLLVYGEQGLGDEVMFASLFGELAQRVSAVAVVCDPRLGSLLARSFPAFEVLGEPHVTQGQRARAHPGITCKVAAGSLGGLFRRSLSDFPRHAGYLVTDPQKVQAWRERLGPTAGKLRIGLSWKGGVQATGRSRRTIPLGQLAPLLALPGISWVSLQHGDDAEAQGVQLARFPEATRDMDELASLIGALDLVVSACNTNVHVSGALGKEVLVMAPFVPEWRYGISGERMVWYPSARVLRQARYGDWDAVLARVLEALRARTL
jgi:Flp pilus assembly protein TadD